MYLKSEHLLNLSYTVEVRKYITNTLYGKINFKGITFFSVEVFLKVEVKRSFKS